MALQSTCYHLCNPWGVTQNFCYPGFRKCYRVCNRWGVTPNFCYPGFRKCYRVCNRWGVTQNCCYPGFGKCYRVCNRWEFLLPSSNRAQKTYQGLVVWPPLPLPAPSPEARSALPPAAAAPPPPPPNGCPWKPSRKQSWAGLVSWPSTARKVSAVKMRGATTCVTGNRYVLPNPLKTGHTKQWCKGDT